jgi:RNA polymerase sigma-70 factor, ECF subfamily
VRVYDITGSAEKAPSTEADEQLRVVFARHFAFVWRSLRRLGVEDAGLDDASQQVWIVVAKRGEEVREETARSLLFEIALRVASGARRAQRRRRDRTRLDDLAEVCDGTPGPDELVDQKRAREILDHVLDTMSFDTRVVFVLYELEQMTVPEITALLDIPSGTVASRLRRGREQFQVEMRRVRARSNLRGGDR